MQALSQLSYGPRSAVSLASGATRYPDLVGSQPKRHRFRDLRQRIARFVRALFGGGSPGGAWDEADGGVGVREPRRPLTPSLTGAAALDLPTDEGDDSR